MSLHIRHPRGLANIVVQAVLSCDGPMCGGEYIEAIPARFTDIAHDLVRLHAVNEHGWSHENSSRKRNDFCRECSLPHGRCGVLDAWLPHEEDDYREMVRDMHQDAADPEEMP